MGTGTQDPLGDPTGMKVKTKGIRVNPKQGSGATRAEIIRTASQEGFADASYRDVLPTTRASRRAASTARRCPPPSAAASSATSR
jgi:hypothetical protein